MFTYNLRDVMSTELALCKKQFIAFMFFSFSFIFFISYFIAVIVEEKANIVGPIKYFYFFVFLFITFLWYLTTKTRLEFDSLITPIFIFIFAIVFYCCLIECQISNLCYTYYIPIIILSLTFFKEKHTILLTLFIIVICYFTKPLSLYLGLSHPIISTAESAIGIQNYKIVIVCMSLFYTIASILFLYKFRAIQNKIIAYKIKSSKKKNSEIVTFEYEYEYGDDKFKVLYLKILELFENDKPYRDPEFNIKSLSEMLNSNHAYVSKTLNQNANKNFKNFVNHYRINTVLEDLNKKNYRKYTIESIYTKAGFTQQSTFNRVFKDKNGITPSEYIEQIENNLCN